MISRHSNSIAMVGTLVLVALAAPVSAQNRGMKPAREQLLLDFNWRFHPGNAASAEADFGYGMEAAFAKAGEAVGAARPDFNDSTWRRVDLPHDWAVELEFVNVNSSDVRSHGYKPIGRQFPETTIGWYRRTFSIPNEDKGKRLSLKFDGVFRDCIVWLNGHYLGRNHSGYSEFSFDITDYLKYERKNVLVMRVDASQYEGWFYEGAGIYRHVWLLKYAPLHVPLYGTFVTSDVKNNNARVTIETKLLNEQAAQATCQLTSSIVDERGTTIGRVSSKRLSLSPDGEEVLHQEVEVPNAHLWSLESRYLYKVVSVIKSGNQIIDQVETPFGIRTIRFDKDSGFYLNDKRVKIKGVCCHQDHAGVGSALPDRLQYYRIERLKEMGCNAYRTSHHQPTPELLEACDKLGMLVMDENRLMGSSPELMGQFGRHILRDRNHPSVIVWSLGNEEWAIQNTGTGRNIALSLRRTQRELDPTRPCTYGADNGDRYEGINSVVDVRGVNYIGRGDIDRYHHEHPDQPIVLSEEASTYCTRGIYVNDTLNGFVSEYDVNAPGYGSTAERWWEYCVARPWLGGGFVWTGFDYRGEPSPYSWPCINSHFGIMDVCGFPKNNYYFYQAWWTNKDVLHLAPHWNWKGRERQPIDVWCESNCDSVELILNGKSLGTGTMERNSHLEWKVAYTPGVLEARGWTRGKMLTTSVATTGPPVTLRLEPDRVSIHGDGEDLSIVTVTALDSLGREVPNAEDLVRFEIAGPGAIVGVGNGNPSSHEADKYVGGKYQRKLFGGKCQVILQAARAPGTVSLTCSSDGLRSAALRIAVEASSPRPFVTE